MNNQEKGFESNFNKKLNIMLPIAILILFLVNFVPSFAQEASLKAMVIEGSRMKSNKSNKGDAGIIHAKGNVELKNESMKINSEEIIINKETKQTTLPVDAKITYEGADNYNVTIFSQYLTGNPETKELDGKNVKMLSDLISYQAATIKTSQPILTLSKTKFSTCQMFKIDEQNQNQANECDVPWSGYASKIIYNTETKQLKAKNLLIKVHGIPVIYTPYLSINLNQKKDGFQQFSPISVNGQQGLTFVYIKENTKYGDFTIQPEIYATQKTSDSSLRAHNIKIHHEYAKNHEKNHFITETDFKTTLLQTNSSKNTNDKGYRYYLMNSNKYYNDSSVTNLNIQASSDLLVRKIYDMKFENYLTSNLSYSNYTNNKFYNVDTTYYKAMTDSNQNLIPSSVSSARYNKILTKLNSNNQVTSKSEMMNFQRVNGLSGTRLNTALELQKTFKFKGFQAETKPSFNILHYTYRNTQIPGVNTKTPDIDFAYRAVGDINTTLSQSFSYNVKSYITQIKPMIFIDYTTDATKGNVINEDSATGFVTDNNIFTMSRYNGIDIVDSGLKGAYGLSVQAQNRNNRKFNFFAGQRYNTSSGFSNYVGRANASLEKMQVSAKFVVKNDGSQILFSNSNISLQPFQFIDIGLGYFYLDKTLQNPQQVGLLNQPVQTIENITYSGSLNYKNHSIFVNMIQNTKFFSGNNPTPQNIITNLSGGFSYKSNCLNYRIGIQNQTSSNNAQNDTQNISITTFILEVNMTK